MRLITSSSEIDRIVSEAINQFKRYCEFGQFVTDDTIGTAVFWQETLHDLVRLAVVAFPITLKYHNALEKYHDLNKIRDLSIWEAVEHEYSTIVQHGLEALSSHDFAMLALCPYSIQSVHHVLWEHLQAYNDPTAWKPAQEWLDAIAIAHHHCVLGKPVLHWGSLLPEPNPKIF